MDEREYDILTAHGLIAEHFGVVKVQAMSVEATVPVLRSHCAALEAHHGVAIGDDVLEMVAALGANVVPPRVLPGTAVDLLDEAASRVRRTSGTRDNGQMDDGGGNVRLSRRVVAEVASRRSGH